MACSLVPSLWARSFRGQDTLEPPVPELDIGGGGQPAPDFHENVRDAHTLEERNAGPERTLGVEDRKTALVACKAEVQDTPPPVPEASERTPAEA